MKKKFIFLVEDNLADVKLVELALSNVANEFELMHFADGQDFLDFIVSKMPPQIDLVLLDLNMPRMGGVDLLKSMSQNEIFKKIPVVVFTSSAHYADVQACFEYGANAYVTKPIDIMDFNSTIQSIANFWTGVNISPIHKEHGNMPLN